jgi:hypothetical protein
MRKHEYEHVVTLSFTLSFTLTAVYGRERERKRERERNGMVGCLNKLREETPHWV